MKIEKNKEIEYLEDHEHILLRPTVYIGSVEKSEEHCPVYEEGRIVSKLKSISVGYYKLLNEIVDNAFDEARRRNGKMKSISISIYSKSGMVIVQDTGNGFTNPNSINPKTKLTNVETAFTKFSSGTNFQNETDEISVVGVNGMGGALTNLFSETFEVRTCDGKKKYVQKWENFKSTKKLYTDDKCKGTTITFTLRKDKFPDCQWDKEIIHTLFLFKNFIKKNDEVLSKLKFEVKFDNSLLDLDLPMFHEDSVYLYTKYGGMVIQPLYEKCTNVGYVNMAMCEGTHQNILHSYVNEILKDEKAHEFYRTFIFLNLEPKYVLFGNQNKTVYKTRKNILEPVIKEEFYKKLKTVFSKSKLAEDIKISIQEKNLGTQVKKLDKIKSTKIVLSTKYYPSSKNKDVLFLVEGDSACGSLNQKRDITSMSTYALKGKINNIKSVKDIVNSNELSELIKILGLDIKGNQKPKYQKIVIASDADVDGMHVSSLILNFFYSWFPNVVKEGHLYQLITPIIKAYNGKNVFYFNTLQDYEKSKSKRVYKNVSYFKGLGSLEEEDWDYVFEELNLYKFTEDEKAKDSISMAFNNKDKEKKKLWIGSGN